MCKYGGTEVEALKTAINDLFMSQLQIQDFNYKVFSMTMYHANTVLTQVQKVDC